MEWLARLDEALPWRVVSGLMLGWLAVFFGRTLLPGRIALIERIALVSDPALPPELRRYTRRLTGVWCAYFVLGALFTVLAGVGFVGAGLLMWAGTAVLFVGEHSVRARLFPGYPFPGIAQQLRDTWSVWRPR